MTPTPETARTKLQRTRDGIKTKRQQLAALNDQAEQLRANLEHAQRMTIDALARGPLTIEGCDHLTHEPLRNPRIIWAKLKHSDCLDDAGNLDPGKARLAISAAARELGLRPPVTRPSWFGEDPAWRDELNRVDPALLNEPKDNLAPPRPMSDAEAEAIGRRLFEERHSH